MVAAKRVDGQIASAAHIRALLSGSERCRAVAQGSVQDPLSFRVAPQVHGAFREFSRYFSQSIEVELAASDDNPYVSIEQGRLISNGNFHPMVLALAADAVRPAIAHAGLLSNDRMSHLWSVIWQDRELATAEGMRDLAADGGLLLRYAAATLYTELRGLASPVTLDVPPLDLGVEDHATNAPLAVRQTDQALDRLDDLLAIELLLARDAIDRSARAARLGDGVAAALEQLRAIIAELGARPSSDVVHGAVRQALHGRIVAAADAACSR